ncbi:hypothetical protein JZ751_027573 [Albula glossodonta]|uniref:Uncharacterized protein n=1 Tax=Albula glossodonta TaxID=121402 RepID=A0A8T2MVL8_9TELE|nr:hypothetical protein JZ751_027573 [Albula glossodonta]
MSALSGASRRSRRQSRGSCCGSNCDTCAPAEPQPLVAMNREEHYYSPAPLYQRPSSDNFSHSPPPCLYMGRQPQAVYTASSLGALDQPPLPDIVPYDIPLIREDTVAPPIHHAQAPQQPVQQAGAYGDPPDLAMLSDRSRYQLPFPWMKSTKSHAHTWRGQWAGKDRYISQAASCWRIPRECQHERLTPHISHLYSSSFCCWAYCCGWKCYLVDCSL